MAKPKTDIQLILEAASHKDVVIYFINDPKSIEEHPDATHIYNKRQKTLKIFVGNLPQRYEASIFSIIRNRFDIDGLIQKNSQEKDYESYLEYKQKNSDNDIIDFFSDKIPEEDLIALKVSLFMISEKQKNKEIHKYKKAIRERFGERGMTIANLCNAGYFEEEFKPKFNKKGKKSFDEYYELCVGKNARAIFVHSGMKYQYLYTSFLSMLRKCSEYKLPNFRVHAFGNQNTNLAKEVIAELLLNEGDRFKVETDEKEHSYIICDVTII